MWNQRFILFYFMLCILLSSLFLLPQVFSGGKSVAKGKSVVKGKRSTVFACRPAQLSMNEGGNASVE